MFQDFFKCNVAGFTGKNNNNGALIVSKKTCTCIAPDVDNWTFDTGDVSICLRAHDGHSVYGRTGGLSVHRVD